ncbi:MAG: DUF373 family protein [Pyrobaculum sp.]
MRILVLYVDRDGDLKSLGYDTPVVGRDEVLKLGIKFILSHPDDSDANAVFAAVKIFDKLAAEYGVENVNVAIVSGSRDPALADLAVLRELDQVLSLYDVDAIYFVSDGPSDEAAISAVQSRRPVVSVYRVVVKQARGVEETVTLFKHYVNKAVKEPEYRRYVVGIPAFLIFIFMLGGIFNIEAIRFFISISLLFIVFFIMLYGFGIYDFLKEVLRKFEFTFIITVVSLFIIVLYLITTFGGQSLVPEYVLVTASILPYVSYIIESYISTKKIRYGALAAGGITFSFFNFLLPTLLKQNRDVFEILVAAAIFITFSLAVSITVYLLRKIFKSERV